MFWNDDKRKHMQKSKVKSQSNPVKLEMLALTTLKEEKLGVNLFTLKHIQKLVTRTDHNK